MTAPATTDEVSTHVLKVTVGKYLAGTRGVAKRDDPPEPGLEGEAAELNQTYPYSFIPKGSGLDMGFAVMESEIEVIA
mgnify:CR=1 FL=1